MVTYRSLSFLHNSETRRDLLDDEQVKSNEKDNPTYTEPNKIGLDRRGINAASVSSKGGLFVSAGGSDDGSGGRKHGEADRNATVT